MYNSNRVDTLSTSGVYHPSAIQRSRSVNTADYFTIFSYGNNNSSQSFNESFSQPNSWSESLDNTVVRNRQRQRLDSGNSDVNPMDGHSFSRVSRGTTPSPSGSRESVGSQQDSQGVRRNYGYIAAFKDVNKGEGAAPPRGFRDTSPSSISSMESIEGHNSRRNFGYMAAFKVSFLSLVLTCVCV